ncbi:winged helix-turn-helix transcriptional regulator [Cupriavidus sp. 2TAF22]
MLLILREVLQGGRHYNQFERSLGIAPNMLSRRLRSLEALTK